MFTPKPNPPRLIPRHMIMLIALGATLAMTALGIRFDVRDGNVLPAALQSIAQSVISPVG